MIPIQIRHFAGGLDPDLVLCKLGKVLQAGDVQGEFPRFREFSKADAQADEIVPGNVSSGFQDLFTNINLRLDLDRD